jgi:kynureninase
LSQTDKNTAIKNKAIKSDNQKQTHPPQSPMTNLKTQDQARALDAQDPIRHARELFDLPEGVIYLDGNSLGARPKSAMKAANHMLVQQWGKGLIGSWNGGTDYESWFTLPQRLGNQLAPIIGAKDGEVLVCDTISGNLFKLLACALQIQVKPRPHGAWWYRRPVTSLPIYT